MNKVSIINTFAYHVLTYLCTLLYFSLILCFNNICQIDNIIKKMIVLLISILVFWLKDVVETLT